MRAGRGRRRRGAADLHDRVLAQHADHVRHGVADEQRALTVENVSAYIWWELVWSPMPPTGLVTIESPSPDSTYTINDTYYALKHFARWTDPGWVRVDATSSVVRYGYPRS